MEDIIMAVKKVVKADEVKKNEEVVATPEVQVETPVDVTETEKGVETEVDTHEQENAVETPQQSPETPSEVDEPEASAQTEVETPVVEVPEVEVETPVATPEVQVETENVKVDSSNKPDGKVKVRMREDHRCYVGQELYDLKGGQCYVIPESVKKRLNKAGLLSPL